MHQWYVVHTKPRQEQIAKTNLERQGYITYYPRIPRMRRRGQSWHRLIEPLFPRYLFIRLSMGEDNFSPIRSTIGVLGLVRFGNTPSVVPHRTISDIRQQEAILIQGNKISQGWKPGDAVEIACGPLAGVTGIFQRADGAERVLILMTMLGRQNTITICPGSLASA